MSITAMTAGTVFEHSQLAIHQPTQTLMNLIVHKRTAAVGNTRHRIFEQWL
jgi:hypothetical protein